jgi:hypothetical protein
MSAIDPSQVPALFIRTVAPVVAATFARLEPQYPKFCEVVAPETATHFPYGDKSSTVIWGAQVTVRRPGEEFKAGTMGEGYAPQGAIVDLSGRMDVSDKDLKANNAHADVPKIWADWARTWAENRILYEDQYVAAMIERGGITAGDTTYFDGSFKTVPDPNAGFIFDGKSLFNTAHLVKFAPGVTKSNVLASAVLSTTTLTNARIAISTTIAVDENNKRYAQKADYIMCSPTLAPLARSLVTSEYGSGALDRNDNFNSLEVIENPFMTDTDAYIVGVKGRSIRAFRSSTPTPEISMDPKTKVWMATLEAMFGAYVREWRTIAAANLPTS